MVEIGENVRLFLGGGQSVSGWVLVGEVVYAGVRWAVCGMLEELLVFYGFDGLLGASGGSAGMHGGGAGDWGRGGVRGGAGWLELMRGHYGWCREGGGDHKWEGNGWLEVVNRVYSGVEG